MAKNLYADEVEAAIAARFNGLDVSRGPHMWGNVDETILVVIGEGHNIEVVVTERCHVLMQHSGVGSFDLRDFTFSGEPIEQILERIRRMIDKIMQEFEIGED